MPVHEGKGSQTRMTRKLLINIKVEEYISKDLTCYGTIIWTADYTRNFFAAEITGRPPWKSFSLWKMLIPLSTSYFLCSPMTTKTLTMGSPLNAVTLSAVNCPSVSDNLCWDVVPETHKYFSYVCKIVFYAHVNYYFRSCVWLRHYRRVNTHPTIAVIVIFIFPLLRANTEYENWLYFGFK